MHSLPVEPQHLTDCALVFVTVFNGAPWNEVWWLADALARLQQIANTPGFYGVIAEEETELIGFALGYAERWRESSHFYLKEMCVTPSHQRQGVGMVLMQALTRDLQRRQVEKLYLLTARGGPAEAF